jgi:hypothetical protein
MAINNNSNNNDKVSSFFRIIWNYNLCLVNIRHTQDTFT